MIKQQQGQIIGLEHQLASNKDAVLMLNEELANMRQHE
jgi:hypothetical protein